MFDKDVRQYEMIGEIATHVINGQLIDKCRHANVLLTYGLATPIF